jgi:ribosomal protein L37AE/L43A
MAKILLHRSSAIDFQCPHCQQAMTVERDMQGIEFDCPSCGSSINCPAGLQAPRQQQGSDDQARILVEIAKHAAETAKAAKEIRNLFAGIMVFWLVLIVLGMIFGVIGSI